MMTLWYWLSRIFSTVPPLYGPPGESDDPTDRNG